MEMAQQSRDLGEKCFQISERNLAHFTIFEGNGVAMMTLAADGVHAQQFAGHLKPRNLGFTGRVHLKSFKMSETDCIQVAERLIHAVERLIAV
jgi:hypothetical protein